MIPYEMEYATIDNNVATSSEASIVEIVMEVIHSSTTGSKPEEHFKTVSDLKKVMIKMSKLKERQSYINEYFKH